MFSFASDASERDNRAANARAKRLHPSRSSLSLSLSLSRATRLRKLSEVIDWRFARRRRIARSFFSLAAEWCSECRGASIFSSANRQTREVRKEGQRERDRGGGEGEKEKKKSDSPPQKGEKGGPYLNNNVGGCDF